MRIFPFSPWHVSAPKYHFPESTTTVSANCSKKGRVELCVMKLRIRKQSLRNLFSSYYPRIIPFSAWASIGSEISLCRFHERVLAKCFLRTKLLLCEMNSQITKKFLKSLFLIFIGGYFLWPHCLQSDPKYQFSDSTKKKRLANGSTRYRCNSVS